MISGPKSPPASNKSSCCWETTEIWEHFFFFFVNSIHRVVKLSLSPVISGSFFYLLVCFSSSDTRQIKSHWGMASSSPSSNNRRWWIKLMFAFPCSLAAQSFFLPTGIVFHPRAAAATRSGFTCSRLCQSHPHFVKPVVSAVCVCLRFSVEVSAQCVVRNHDRMNGK